MNDKLEVPKPDPEDYREMFSHTARQQGFLVLPEYNFDHLVYMMTENKGSGLNID